MGLNIATLCFSTICYSVAISLESGCLAGITTLPPSPIVRSLCPFTAGGHGVVDPKFQDTGCGSELLQFYKAAGIKVV